MSELLFPTTQLIGYLLFLLSCTFFVPNLHLFTDNIKVQYLQFMTYMKTPQYCSNLQQLLEKEKVISNSFTDVTAAVFLFTTISCQHIKWHVFNHMLSTQKYSLMICHTFFYIICILFFLSVSSKNTGTCQGRRSSSTLSVSLTRTRSKVSFRPN